MTKRRDQDRAWPKMKQRGGARQARRAEALADEFAPLDERENIEFQFALLDISVACEKLAPAFTESAFTWLDKAIELRRIRRTMEGHAE